MIDSQIENESLRQHLASISADSRETFLLYDSQVRCTAVNGSLMLNKMRANHKLNVLDSYILGQAYLAGALLCATVKGEDRVQLTVECAGPIKGIYVEACATGWVRGYLKNHPIVPEKPLENGNISPLFGPGFLSVSKLIEGNKAPFTGQVMLQYGNLAKDLSLYFRESEQTPSLFFLSIDFAGDGTIKGAGGLFLQILPQCKDHVLSEIEEKAKQLPSLGRQLAEGSSVRNYVQKNFPTAEYLSSTPVQFFCPCRKENFAHYLSKLPRKEKDDILANGPFPLELVCFNCNSTYKFTKDELIKLLK